VPVPGGVALSGGVILPRVGALPGGVALGGSVAKPAEPDKATRLDLWEIRDTVYISMKFRATVLEKDIQTPKNCEVISLNFYRIL
jgi:hypothetical protein